jgi:hypothetical protein
MTATRITPMLIGADGARWDVVIRPYDPRPKKGGRGILVVAGLLGFIFVVSHAGHYLNSDDSAATTITTVTASAVPPERTAAPATTDNPTTTPADPTTDPPAPVAGADAGTDYGSTHAAAICATLTENQSLNGNQSFDGIMSAAGKAVTDGLSAYQAGEALATAVGTTCPQFVPLIAAFAHMGTTTAV